MSASRHPGDGRARAETVGIVDDLRRTSFRTVTRGYDRAQVDEYVRKVNSLITAVEDNDFERVAPEWVDDADAEAAQIRETAQQEVEALRARAESAAEALRVAAEEEAASVREQIETRLREFRSQLDAATQQRDDLLREVAALAERLAMLTDWAAEIAAGATRRSSASGI